MEPARRRTRETPTRSSTSGLMYRHGRGVAQNYVAAHMWLNLTVAQLSGRIREIFVKEREAVAALMTPEQIAEAQRLAREWKPTVEP